MKSLVGDYREEHICTLGQSLKCYRHYQNMIEEVDHRVKGMMQRLPSKVTTVRNRPKRRIRARPRGGMNRRSYATTSIERSVWI
jgi:hypothetical protein